jgi:hypothetical protein
MPGWLGVSPETWLMTLRGELSSKTAFRDFLHKPEETLENP